VCVQAASDVLLFFAVAMRWWQLSSVYRGMQREYKPGLCSSCR